MYWTLAVRHLLVRPGRAAMLFGGYAIGVAVMIVLLSVGDAMLSQSRDVSLLAGGELIALPHGVDVEAMRTGGLTGILVGITGARFVSREMIGGPRERSVVAAVSPVLGQKLLEIRTHDTLWTVRAGGEIPSAAAAVGAGTNVVTGAWHDTQPDRDWSAPSGQTFYDEIDRFHTMPSQADGWAEWHYFNVVVSEHEWWYVTLLVAGDSGGAVLATHRLPDGQYLRHETRAERSAIAFDTARADLAVGASRVTQRNGSYRVQGKSAAATFDFVLTPAPRRYFPPVELGDNGARSGYVVPALSATATGRFCDAGSCRDVRAAEAYHDHNWGGWRSVTWEWGAGSGASHALIYGGTMTAGASGVPFFLALEDSLGVEQIYRFRTVERRGVRDVPGSPGIVAPAALRIVAVRGDDTLRLTIDVADVAASRSASAGPGRTFLQMRGKWRVAGTAAGVAVADSGSGFFETWVGTTPE